MLTAHRVLAADGPRLPRVALPKIFGPWLIGAGLLVLSWLPSHAVFAQGTARDYQRMQRVQGWSRQMTTRDRVTPHWFADGQRCWYRNDLGDGRTEFVLVDPPAGTRTVLFQSPSFAPQLAQALGRPIDRERLPFREIEPSADGKSIRLTIGAAAWDWELSSELLRPAVRVPPMPFAPEEAEPRENGRGRRRDRPATIVRRGFDLWLREHETGRETALTTSGTADVFYEERVHWSPDGRYAIGWQTTRGEDRKIHLIESSPKDQLQPKLHTLGYAKPGDRLAISRPMLITADPATAVVLHNATFSNPWAITHEAWSPEGDRFTFLYNERGHQVLRWIEVTAKTGTIRTILEERSPTFIDYAHKVFLHHEHATGEAIWMSERSGWNHLYMVDVARGQIRQPITQGEWVVRGVDRVDAERRQIWFRAGGIDPQQDPYHVLFCRVDFDGRNLVVLTPGDGTHRVEWSPTRDWLIDTQSRIDEPPVTTLRDARDGRLVCVLESADISRLKQQGWTPPERFTAKGRDGQTNIYGVIFRPTNFDPKQRYPVIECIYAGPHGSFVPKEFAPNHYGQSLAELGFIVVRMDGMGTSHRSKAFHDVCWKNLGDSGFPDRIAWIKAAAERYPQLDLSRVGIFGGSAGGQSTVRGLLAHGDFYHVGVADCGCHDNRMDKVWWNELWMGWPIGPHYAEQSNVTQAHRLRGKLMLVVGELDRNVDPASTLQVAHALIKADKDFELLLIPGAGHGAAESAYGQRRRADFFVRHLWGREPRAAD